MSIVPHPDPDYDRQMTQKELAAWNGCHRNTMAKFVERGFPMNGGTASPRQLVEWLKTHPLRPWSKKWD